MADNDNNLTLRIGTEGADSTAQDLKKTEQGIATVGDATAAASEQAAQLAPALDTSAALPSLKAATEATEEVKEETVAAAREAKLLAEAYAQIAREDDVKKVNEFKEAIRAAREEQEKAASSAKSSASETNEALSETSESADEVGFSFEEINKEASGLRGATTLTHHFAEAFKGDVGGMLGIVRLFAQGLEGLPVISSLIVVGSIVAGVLSQVAGAKKEDEAATESQTTATDALAASMDRLQKAAAADYPDIASYLKTVSDELLKQVDATKQLQSAQDELKDAEMADKIAALDLQETEELDGKTVSQQALIRRKYVRERLALRQQTDDDKAARDIRDKQAALEQANQAVLANQQQQSYTGSSMEKARAVLNGGAIQGVKGFGIKSDAQTAAERLQELIDLNNKEDPITGTRHGLTTDQQKELEGLRGSFPQLQEDEKINGPSFANELDKLQERKKKASDAQDKAMAPGFVGSLEDVGLTAWRSGTSLTMAGGNAARAQSVVLNGPELAEQARQQKLAAGEQILAIQKYQASIKAAQDTVDKLTPKEQDLTSAFQVLTTNVKTASTQLETAQKKASVLPTVQATQKLQLQQSQTHDISVEQFQLKAADLQNQINALGEKLKAPDLTPAGKAALETQRTELQSQLLDNNLVTNPDLTAPEKVQLQGQQQNLGLATQVGNANTTAAAKKKALGDTLDLAETVAPATGDKDLQEQLKLTIETLKKTPNDPTALVDLFRELNQVLAEAVTTNAGMQAQINKLATQVSDHANALKAQRNGNNN